jgi:hypothetical protein
MSDLSKDLQADLLADLTPAEAPAPAVPVAEPEALPQELTDATPSVNVAWTPLRWSRPKVVRASTGPGKALRLGPLTVEVTVKE